MSTAIAATDRTGTWKMETRSNTKAELTLVEQRLEVLSRPAPPRPVRTVREALGTTNVPQAIWKDSNECANIQESVYFKKACAQTVQLRRELAASEDYERLSARAAELRKGLAEAPIVATSDPLPAAFSATFGRLLPLEGADGVAWLFTIAVELLSCFGLAGLGVLYRGRHQGGQEDKGSPAAQATVEAEGPSKSTARNSGRKPSLGPSLQALPRPSLQALPRPSPRATTIGCTSPGGHRDREASAPPNVLPKRRSPARGLPESLPDGPEPT